MTRLHHLTPIGLLIAGAMVAFSGCDSSDPIDNPEPIDVIRVSDFAADPIIGIDPNTGQPIGTGRFAFFSLRENAAVPASDSATARWDLAMRGTTVLVNGGTSGPGEGSAQVWSGAFEDLTEAPADGYATDSDAGNAIPTGAGNGWYNYNPQINLISPIPGRVLVVRTADGLYAKIRILSYYRGAPETPDPQTDDARYYTFEYVLQPDGSRSFAD